LITFGQLMLAVSIPTIVALIGVIFNQVGLYRLSDKVDRLVDSVHNDVTALLREIHAVSERVTKLEAKQ
jgi:nitrogen-specific signal transduction histidine kinase